MKFNNAKLLFDISTGKSWAHAELIWGIQPLSTSVTTVESLVRQGSLRRGESDAGSCGELPLVDLEAKNHKF